MYKERGGKGVVSLFDVAVSLPPLRHSFSVLTPLLSPPFPPLHSAQLDSLLPPWAAALEDLAGAEQRAADARHARDRRTTPSSPSRPQRSPTAAEVRAAAEQRAMGALFDTQFGAPFGSSLAGAPMMPTPPPPPPPLTADGQFSRDRDAFFLSSMPRRGF